MTLIAEIFDTVLAERHNVEGRFLVCMLLEIEHGVSRGIELSVSLNSDSATEGTKSGERCESTHSFNL